MLSQAEFEEQMQHLKRRHRWMSENLEDRADMYKQLCAELGVNYEHCMTFLQQTIESATGIPVDITLALAPEIIQSMAVSFWLGILIGKKIKEVETL